VGKQKPKVKASAGIKHPKLDEYLEKSEANYRLWANAIGTSEDQICSTWNMAKAALADEWHKIDAMKPEDRALAWLDKAARNKSALPAVGKYLEAYAQILEKSEFWESRFGKVFERVDQHTEQKIKNIWDEVAKLPIEDQQAADLGWRAYLGKLEKSMLGTRHAHGG
jgi:hypothetical protein